jgi:hypothetical protein
MKRPKIIYVDVEDESPKKRKKKKNEFLDIFISGARITLKIFVWCIRQVLSLMAEGMSGVASGMKEAQSIEKKKTRGRLKNGRRRI